MKNTLLKMALNVAFMIATSISIAQTTYYVDAGRPDNTGAGTSWLTAKRDLQVVINAAASGDAIWVKAGTYLPTHDPFGSTAPANNRDKTFTLKNGVKIYGGFAGTETSLGQRNWITNVTTLSGDLGTINTLSDNAYHVVISANLTNATALDGLVITKGYATAPNGSQIIVNTKVIERFYGGGVFNIASGTTFTNCTIRENSADCTNQDNDALGAGAVNLNCSSSFTNCIIDSNSFLIGGNSFGVFGAGMVISGGNCSINNCVFSNNTSGSGFFDGSRGGALELNGTHSITNTVFYNNAAQNGAALQFGGADGNTTTVTNCSFVNNTSSFVGTAYQGFSKATFKNCLFWNNTPTVNGVAGRNEIYSQDNRVGFQPTFQNCIIRDAVGSPLAITNAVLVSCLNSNPLFVNAADGDGLDNRWATNDDGLAIQTTSPAKNFGVTGSGIPITDIIGNTRDGQPDLGAYEYQNPCVNPTVYNVNGGGSYCAGGVGQVVVVSNSEVGVTYQLKNGSTNVGTAINGTGNSISFGNQTAAGTYTVIATRTLGSCSATMNGSAIITVNPNVTPTFTAVAPICSGAALSALPNTSNNSIAGIWSPAIDNTQTTTYTFTPTSGQCATTASMIITVNPNITPTFTAVAPICSGAALSALPSTSNNAIAGIWSPALDNTQTTTYTFTPTSGQCATTASLIITVNDNVTPTFTAVAPICSGAALSALPSTSNNAIAGIWSPALDNTQTTTYTFTPTSGQCATTASLIITVNDNVTPTFTAVAPICSGAALSALPSTSNNAIAGIWSPALDNTQTTTYTFTPTSGQCATTASLIITVNDNVTPTFTAVAPICSGAALSELPSTSNNAIAGIWSPALDNTQTTTYTFTPTSGQCATTTSLIITVNDNVTPTFTAVAPICSGAALSELPSTSNNAIAGIWSPALDNTQTTTYTFTPTSGQCATTASMIITVNSNITPTFTAVAPICSGAALSELPSTSNNSIAGTWSPALDNTQTTTYTFTPTSGQCATTASLIITVNDNVTPTFTAVAPICSGAALSELPSTSNNSIAGIWSPALDNTQTTTYTFTPTSGQCATTASLIITVNDNVTPTFTAVAPICSGAALSALPSTSNNAIAGIWSPALDNTQTTTYTFTPTSGQCATTASMIITVNSNITPTFTAVAPICSGAALSELPSTSNNSIAGIWSPAIDNTQTTTYTFTPTSGQCATTASMIITVNSNITPTFTAVAPICSGAALSELPSTSNNSIAGIWSPAIDNTQTTTYTFTPTSGQCATTASLIITVNDNVTPTFTAVAPICSGAALSELPSTSNNAIAGIWSPALDNTQTTTYTFTPTSGQCATTASLIITVNDNITPTFTAVAPICSGAALSALPSTSNNAIAGIWSPALDNTQTTTYTFTPTSGQCATTASLIITVNDNLTPTFTAVAPICSGAALSELPSTSNNAIAGIWSPALDNTQTTMYTFTPTSGQCATETNMTIIVNITEAPTGSATQDSCFTGTLADIQVDGMNVIWYSTPLGNEVLPLDTTVVNGSIYYASQTVSGCESQDRFAVTTSGPCLNIDSFNGIKVSYLPNPVITQLTVSSEEKVTSYNLINSIGQLLIKEEVNDKNFQVDMSHLPSGNYLLRLSSDTKFKTLKLIKN